VGKPLADDCSLAQALDVYLTQTGRQVEHDVGLVLRSCEYDEEVEERSRGGDSFDDKKLAIAPLDAFVKCDGLVVLAECLPSLMPYIHEPLLNVTDKDRSTSANGAGGAAGGGSGGNSGGGESTSSAGSGNNGGGAGTNADQTAAKTAPDFVDYVLMNESDEPFVDEMGYGGSEMTMATSNSVSGNSSFAFIDQLCD
jgi:hypothetical protein